MKAKTQLSETSKAEKFTTAYWKFILQKDLL